jgi:hypothetical protein
MNDMIQKLLASKGPALVSSLTSTLGIDSGKAEGFLQVALSKVGDLVQGGGFDLGSLLGGDATSQIMEKLDVDAIASETDLDGETVTKGLKSLLPEVMSSLGGGNDGGGLLGAASKLFG